MDEEILSDSILGCVSASLIGAYAMGLRPIIVVATGNLPARRASTA